MSIDGSTARRLVSLVAALTAALLAGGCASQPAPATPAPATPQTGVPSAEAASTIMATAPDLGSAPRLVLPSPTETTLPNGLTVKLVGMHEVPVVQAVLTIEGGARLDGELAGLATFVGGMLDEGAGDRDAFELAAQVEYLGASLGTGAGWDATTISLRAPKRTIGDAMAVMGDVVLQPRFAAEDVERQRDLRIASILQSRDQPGAVAGNVFGYTVYPAAHPYHRPIGGDSISTVQLDSAVVREFWNRAADPRRATLVIAGDLTLDEARALATSALGSWQAPTTTAAADPARAAEPPRPTTRVFLVDKPEAAQSVLMIGAPGVARSSPDYPAITLMNTILGGSFSSRLNDILREQKGFTYGARSNYSWRPLPGPFVASAAVRTDVTDSSLAIFFDEFRRIRSEPVTPQELDRAKSYITLGALGEFETTGQVAGELSSLEMFGLTLADIPKELDQVKALGAADVQRAAERYLDPAHLTIVVVGDVKNIRAGVEALSLGPVTLLDHEGNEVTP
ncbi:MAG TPA: pitrilysin family protein [Gemmatimonadales bacterium]|nr:pitrilysin family protein [Gemmatimonadales bacterium]